MCPPFVFLVLLLGLPDCSLEALLVSLRPPMPSLLFTMIFILLLLRLSMTAFFLSISFDRRLKEVLVLEGMTEGLVGCSLDFKVNSFFFEPLFCS